MGERGAFGEHIIFSGYTWRVGVKKAGRGAGAGMRTHSLRNGRGGGGFGICGRIGFGCGDGFGGGGCGGGCGGGRGRFNAENEFNDLLAHIQKRRRNLGNHNQRECNNTSCVFDDASDGRIHFGLLAGRK